MDSVLKQLRAAAGIKQQTLGDAANLSREYVSLMETEQRQVSFKAAGQLAKALDVDEDELFVTHNLRALKNRVDAGTTPPHQALQSLAHIVKFMDAAPGFDKQVADATLKEAKRLADQLVAAKTKSADALLGRDTLGLAVTKRNDPAAHKATTSSYQTGNVRVASPIGDMGSGRPDSLASVSDPSARSLVDAVSNLEQDIENGTVSGPGILASVANIVGAYSEVDTSGNTDAAEAYRNLKQLAADAAKEIGASSTAKKGRTDPMSVLGRGAGGRKLVKKYGA